MNTTTAAKTVTMNLEQRFLWENGLQEGEEVIANWTNNFSYWSARTEIVRVNRASVRVRLVADVTVDGRLVYPKGRELVIPRCVIQARTWSQNNCIEPVGEVA